MSVVLFEELTTANGKKIAVATLNSPKSLNALNIEMIRLLTEKLIQWQNNNTIALVILKGAGDKAFCAGGDVVSLYHALSQQRKVQAPDDTYAVLDGRTIRESIVYDFFTLEYALDQLTHEYAKPILVWGDGYVMGGGIGLFAGASHKVVTEKTLLAMPEITIGLYPDVGASWFLNKLPAGVGLFLGLTGAMFNAIDAKNIGLADEVIDSSDESAFLENLLDISWQDALSNHQLLSQVLNKYSLKQTCDPASQLTEHEEFITSLDTHDNGGDVYRAILDYQTDDKWFLSAQRKLKNGSPLSALVIYEQLKLSQSFDLSACFASELNLSLRCCQFPEFSEGVRALLVDKDKQPQWSYENLEDIPNELINWFFKPFLHD